MEKESEEVLGNERLFNSDFKAKGENPASFYNLLVSYQHIIRLLVYYQQLLLFISLL